MNFKLNTKQPMVDEDQVNWQGKCIAKFQNEVFQSLAQVQMQHLQELVIPVKYPEGDLLFQEGGLSDGIYLICNGFVVYGKGYHGGSERGRIFKLLGPGEMVGEETLFTENTKSRFGYARCIVDGEFLFLEKGELLNFLYDNPEGFHDICNYLSSSLKQFEVRLLDEGHLNTDKRLANLLMKIENQWGGDKQPDGPICLKLKRKILAGILGVSEGSITRILNKLEENGLVSIHNENLCIESREELKEFVAG